MTEYRRELRTFDTSTLTASYQDIGAPLPFSVSNVSITNTSTVGVLITDGKSDQDIEVPGGGTLSIGEGLSPNAGTSVRAVFTGLTQLGVKRVTAAAAGKLIINMFG